MNITGYLCGGWGQEEWSLFHGRIIIVQGELCYGRTKEKCQDDRKIEDMPYQP